MCSEQHPLLPGPETQMHFCPTFQKVPPEAVCVGPSERCGEPITEEQLLFDNSWTQMVSVYTSTEMAVALITSLLWAGQICTYTAQTWRQIVKPGRYLETLSTAEGSALARRIGTAEGYFPVNK